MNIRNLHIALLIAVVLAFSVAGCSHHSRELADIDAIIEADPASALESLEQIDPAALHGADTAYYALLYTQARVKCKQPDGLDSIIERAYRQYITSGNDDLKMRAAFYRAQVAYDRQDLPAAMKDVLIAYEIAKDHHDHYWTAKAAELIGDIYFDSYNYWQAETYTAEAAREYLAAGKIVNHRYALCDLAITYLNEDRYSEGLKILDSLKLVLEHEDSQESHLYNYIEVTRYPAMVSSRRCDSVINVVSTSSNAHYLQDNEITQALAQSKVLVNSKEFEKADELIQKAYSLAQDSEQSTSVMYSDYRAALSRGDYQRAAILSDSLLMLQSGLVLKSIKDAITIVQRDYYESESVQQLQRNKNMKTIFIIVSIAVILLISLLIVIYQQRLRTRKTELESMMMSVISLSDKAEQSKVENQELATEVQIKSLELSELRKQEEYSKLEIQQLTDVLTEKLIELSNARQKLSQHEDNNAVIESLFHSKWNTLNMLCQEYLKNENTKLGHTILYTNIEKELKKLTSKKNLTEIERAVDSYMGGIMSKLRKECDFLGESDFVFLSLVYAGFTVNAICYILKIKYKYFYLKKERLKKRILESEASNKQLFLDKIP